MKTVLVAATLALVLTTLAGCSGKGGDSSDSSTDDGGGTNVTEGTTSNHGVGPGSSGPSKGPVAGGNHAPTGSMQVSATKGGAPFRVNFTLDGADQDHDALTWTLDANGDGTADSSGKTLPYRANFTYTTPGLFNVKFTITDGKQDVSYPAQVNVTANAPQGAQAPITITGTISGAYVGVGIAYTNVDTYHFDLTSVPNKITATITWGQTGVDLDMYIDAPDGTEAGAANNYNDPAGVQGPPTEPPVVIEDPTFLNQLGQWTVIVGPGEAAQTDYTVTITFS